MNHNDIFGWCDFTSIYSEAVEENESGLLVEIGSFLGKSAAYMAEEIKKSGKDLKVVCIDLFPTPDELIKFAGDGAGQGEEHARLSGLPDSHINTFVNNIRQCDVEEFVIPVKSSSHKAHVLFADNSLNFVFLDAGHGYDTVKKDLELWWPKIASGKVMAGHDFFEHVERAVRGFFEPLSVDVERRGSSWWVRKP